MMTEIQSTTADGRLQDEVKRLKAHIKALEAREQRCHDALSNADEGISMVDANGNYISVNPAFCRMTGYSEAELLSMNIRELISPEEKSVLFRKVVNRRSGRRQTELIKKDGSCFHAEITGHPVKLDDQWLALGIVRDISLKKKAEEARLENEEKYRSLFNNMIQGAFYRQSDGSITDINPAGLEMFGLTRDQFLGKALIDPGWKVIREDGSDFPGEQQPSMESLQTGKPVKNKIIGVFNPNRNEHVWLNIDAIPQFKEGEEKPYRVFVTMHDITERKKSEEKLRESEGRFRAIFEQAAVGVAQVVTRTGEFLRINKRYADIVGYT
ncbi:MAG: PAS domain S-box protein, partial [Desulfobacteraceae bacterium]|nr:PAS domain S-box protein [Desulfobacteraceae bacterium]